MNCFNYKGYQGSIEASIKDNCLYGKILFINDLILYEGNTLEELKKNFEEAVEDYLETCKEAGIEPKKPFKGSFNIRIGKELHEKAARRAEEIGKSLNDYVKDAIKADLESHA
jgi:predicted HicB family RNase H-like nuclease